MMPPKVSIIIVNWNGKADTLECLQSLRQLDYSTYEILVIDNASSDDSIHWIQQQFPEVMVLQNAENLGFAEGNNVGIRYALTSGSQYVLLLNNDTIVAPEFLTALVDVGECHPDVGMLNPAIYTYPTKDVWFLAGKIDWNNGVTQHVTERHECPAAFGKDALIATDYVTGCALLVKAEAIRQIGMLDTRFFAYYEDTDWSVRCQKAGWKTVVVPEAKIWHKVSATAAPEKAFIWGHRNLILFLWKHSTLWQFPLRFKHAVYKCLHELTWHREKILGEAAMHGLWSAMTLRFGKEYRKMPNGLLRFIQRNVGCFLKLFG